MLFSWIKITDSCHICICQGYTFIINKNEQYHSLRNQKEAKAEIRCGHCHEGLLKRQPANFQPSKWEISIMDKLSAGETFIRMWETIWTLILSGSNCNITYNASMSRFPPTEACINFINRAWENETCCRRILSSYQILPGNGGEGKGLHQGCRFEKKPGELNSNQHWEDKKKKKTCA